MIFIDVFDDILNGAIQKFAEVVEVVVLMGRSCRSLDMVKGCSI